MTGCSPIDYLRVSVTDRCNFRCRHCMPPEGIEFKDHERILSYEEIERFAQVAAGLGISRIRVTGGEPLVRRQCPDLVAMLARIPGIEDVSLTTNGSLLAEYASALSAAGLDRVNISIDSLDPERFAAITGGARLEPVLAGLHAALEHGFTPVKVNVVMLAGIDEELEGFVRMARELPVHLRFIECMPVGRRVTGLWKFVPRDRVMAGLERFGELAPASSPGGAGPARYFQLAGAAGTIGFISAMSDHICGNCNRIRLTADGKLRSCLFSSEEEDIRPLIGGSDDVLRERILATMNGKNFDRKPVNPGERTMSQIGG
ncbi:MAG: GTP 3',8-cyclase MoaA [Thermoleophilia bacterium]